MLTSYSAVFKILLVTHQVQYLPLCDRIIVLESGEVKHFGTYDELVAAGADLQVLLVHEENAAAEAPPTVGSRNDDTIDVVTTTTTTTTGDEHAPLSEDVSTVVSSTDVKESKRSLQAAARKKDNRESSIMSEEERSEGRVSFEVFAFYLRAGGFGLFIIALIVLIIGRSIEISALFYLSYWCSQSLAADQAGRPLTSQENIQYINVYAGLSMSGVMSILFRAVVMTQFGYRASVYLHNRLVS